MSQDLPTADELIASGKYDLRLDPDIVLEVGEHLSYTVIKGGRVQKDGTVPVTVRMTSPPRLAGRSVPALLVPAEMANSLGEFRSKSKDLMRDVGWFGSFPKAEA